MTGLRLGGVADGDGLREELFIDWGGAAWYMRCCCCCPVGGEPGYPENQRKLDQFKRRQTSSLVPSCGSGWTQGARHPL